MADNIFGGRPNVAIAKQTISMQDAGITAGNTAVIYLVDVSLQSYIPGRSINPFTGFVANKAYYIQAVQDMDLEAILAPPLPIGGAVGGWDFTDAIIVCDGNSLTAGQGASAAGYYYPSQLYAVSGIDAAADVINKGIGGQTTQEMIDDAVSDIDSLYDHRVKSILIAWEIGNDLYFNGNVANAQERFEEYCLDRKAVGWLVFVVTLPARDHSVTNGGITPAGDSDSVYNEKRAVLNEWLRNNYQSFAHGICDVAANSGFLSYNTTNYNPDRVHLNDTGYGLVANIVADALKNTIHF